MGIESEWIWMDGAWVPYGEARVHVLSHTLHYGLGAFEGIRAYDQGDGTPGIWRLGDHVDRLLQSLKMARLACPHDHQTLSQACLEVLERNAFAEAYVRPLAFLGTGAMGLGARNNPLHVVVAAWQWGALPRRGGPRERGQAQDQLLQPQPPQRRPRPGQDRGPLRQQHPRPLRSERRRVRRSP